jgi:CcdB protein
MAQFDVYRNANPELLEPLATRIVVPLCKLDAVGGKPAERLNPQFEIEGRSW